MFRDSILVGGLLGDAIDYEDNTVLHSVGVIRRFLVGTSGNLDRLFLIVRWIRKSAIMIQKSFRMFKSRIQVAIREDLAKWKAYEQWKLDREARRSSRSESSEYMVSDSSKIVVLEKRHFKARQAQRLLIRTHAQQSLAPPKYNRPEKLTSAILSSVLVPEALEIQQREVKERARRSIVDTHTPEPSLLHARSSSWVAARSELELPELPSSEVSDVFLRSVSSASNCKQPQPPSPGRGHNKVLGKHSSLSSLRRSPSQSFSGKPHLPVVDASFSKSRTPDPSATNTLSFSPRNRWLLCRNENKDNKGISTSSKKEYDFEIGTVSSTCASPLPPSQSQGSLRRPFPNESQVANHFVPRRRRSLSADDLTLFIPKPCSGPVEKVIHPSKPLGVNSSNRISKRTRSLL